MTSVRIPYCSGAIEGEKILIIAVKMGAMMGSSKFKLCCPGLHPNADM